MPKPVIPTKPSGAWRDLAGFRIAGDLHSKPRKSLCDRILLTFATASRCLHSLRSVDMTALAAFAIRFCQKNCVFLCKGTKLQNSAKPNSGLRMPVYVLNCFGCLCNQVLPKKLRFSLQRHKTEKSCVFCDCLPVFYGGILTDFRIAECVYSKSV